jgi:hypothetical protein
MAKARVHWAFSTRSTNTSIERQRKKKTRGSVWKERGIEGCLLVLELLIQDFTRQDQAAIFSQNTEILNRSKTRICHFIRTSALSTIIPFMLRTNWVPAKFLMQTHNQQAHKRLQSSLQSKDTLEGCLVVSNLSTNNCLWIQRTPRILPRETRKPSCQAFLD